VKKIEKEISVSMECEVTKVLLPDLGQDERGGIRQFS
jgi:hypothetical protein